MDFIRCSVFDVKKRLCNYRRVSWEVQEESFMLLPFSNGAQWSELYHFDFPVGLTQPFFFWFLLDVVILSFSTYTFVPFLLFIHCGYIYLCFILADPLASIVD